MIMLLTALAVAGGNCFAATPPYSGRADEILAAGSALAQPLARQPLPGKNALGDTLPAGAIARLGTARLRSVGFKFALSADGNTIFTAARGILGRADARTGGLIDETEVPIEDENNTWFSTDGKLLAFNRAGPQSLLEVWDAAARKRLQRLPVLVSHVAFSPDGMKLAGVDHSEDFYRIRIWDIATGKDQLFAKLPANAKGIVFSPNGKRLFAAVHGQSLHCWDVAKGLQLWEIKHSASQLAIAPDGKMLCTQAEFDAPLDLWEAETGKHRGQLGAGKEGIGQLAFAPNGNSLAQGGRDTLLWDLGTQKIRLRLEGFGPCVVFSPDSRSIFTMGTLVLRWDVGSGKLQFDDSNQGHIGPVSALTFGPDGQSLASVGLDLTLRLWKLADNTHRTLRTGLPLSRWEPKNRTNSRTRKPGPVFFTPDGHALVMDITETTLGLVDVKTGKEIRRFQFPPPREKESYELLSSIEAVQVTPDGRHLLALGLFRYHSRGSEFLRSELQPIRVWELATGKEVLAREETEFEGAQFSPDGRLLIRESDHGLYHVKTGRLLPTDWWERKPLAFSADSRLVAITQRDVWDGPAMAIKVYDMHTQQQLARFEPQLAWHAPRALSADGQLLAVAGSDALHVWETSTGKRLMHLPAKGRLEHLTLDGFATCLTFSPDGKSLATGHADGTVILWDMTPAWKNLTLPAGPVDLAACWEALADPDPRKAYAAIGALTAAPGQALPLLQQKLAAVKVDQKWLAARLVELGSDKFTVREQASHELEKVAEAVETDLRKLLEKPPSQEVRNRLTGILKTLEAAAITLSPAALRELRALTVLERIGTKEAQALLRDLAAGAPDARLTQDAAAALGRLKMRFGD